jgi:FixJ family two-component response regulator
MAKPTRRPCVVAIVEDDAGVRSATESLLRSAGYATRSFASAEEFLRSRRGRRPDCLILDVELPHMNGLELQASLVQKRIQIPAVFITANEDSRRQFETQALQSGAVALLRKPFDDKELLQAVRLGCSRRS